MKIKKKVTNMIEYAENALKMEPKTPLQRKPA